MSTASASTGLEVKARLLILGFECPAEEITKVVGVVPTQTWRRGDRVSPVATNVHKENAWVLHSPADPHSASPEDAVRALLGTLPSMKAFRSLPDDVEIQLTCTVYGHSERPYVYLPAELVERVGELRASLDIDTYDLTSTEDPIPSTV